MTDNVVRLPVAEIDAGLCAVIDLGSNSVRLVVYDTPFRAPVVIYNERLVVGLARQLGATGKLPRSGRARALRATERFVALGRGMGVSKMRIIATAAVRDAQDGTSFLRGIQARTGLSTEITDGHREAYLSALGLLSGVPDADGIMGDMGGGSIEFVEIKAGGIGRDSSLPSGILRLIDKSNEDPRNVEAIFSRRLEKIEWLGEGEGKPFYAIGGSWRAIARVMQRHEKHPLPVIHGYTLEGNNLAERLEKIVHMPRRKIPQSVPQHRREGVPYAAAALAVVVRKVRPSSIVFSSYGLREGVLVDIQGSRPETFSPLRDGCAALGAARRAFVGDPALAAAWIEPAFTPKERGVLDPDFALAASFLSDIAWNEHPEHRARYAFKRVALRPLFPVRQGTRVCLALALHARYTSARLTGKASKIAALVPHRHAAQAQAVGFALRLAMTVTGGATTLLDSCKLRTRDGVLELVIPSALANVVVSARLKILARALNRESRLVRT